MGLDTLGFLMKDRAQMQITLGDAKGLFARRNSEPLQYLRYWIFRNQKMNQVVHRMAPVIARSGWAQSASKHSERGLSYFILQTSL